MTLRAALGAMAAALLLSVTACAASPDPGEWAKHQFSGKRWGAPGVHSAAGGIGHGSEAGLEFTPAHPGWYEIGMACQGASSITVTVAASDGELGTGATDCGSEVTTTMELPASQITIAIEGTEAQGQWAIAVAPAEAPQPG